MKLVTYVDLIKALKVRNQAFRSKRDTWVNSLGGKTLPPELEGIFGNQPDVFISRQDIFNETAKTNPNLEKIVYLTILWGYPTGRNIRVHFSSIVDQMLKLTQILGQVRECDISDWNDHFSSADNRIPGLGLSTYSKLLYFLDVKVGSYDALILDRQVVKVFQGKVFDDFSELAHLKYENAPQYYVCYLREMDRVARLLDVRNENVEMFLFTFGSQLKVNEH